MGSNRKCDTRRQQQGQEFGGELIEASYVEQIKGVDNAMAAAEMPVCMPPPPPPRGLALLR
jgi:hypothetical protein